MDTNENNQQINVFNKGMNTDTSDAYIGTDQYRMAKNLRFITDTGENSGELRLIDGYVKSGHMSNVDKESKYKILAATSIRDLGIVIVEDKNTNWSIYTFGEGSAMATKVFGPCSDELGEQLSLVTRWESEENIKLYIADGKNELMSLNISKPSNFNTIKSLVSVDIDNLPNISTSILANGNLPSPVLLYCYRIYDLYGNASSVSPLTKPVVLYKNSGEELGYSNIDLVNKGVSLSIKGLSATNYYIQIFRIAYIQNGLQPKINIIYDGKFSANSTGVFNIDDIGQNISELSYAEFTSLYDIKITPLLIESKGDYLFSANITYDQKNIDDLFAGCTVTYGWNRNRDNAYDIDLNNEVRSVRTGEVTGICPSFRPGETYRFGVVFYDKSGNKSSVMHIKDLEIDAVLKGDVNSLMSGFTNHGTTVTPISVTASIVLTPTAKNNISGCELVRCNRTISDSKVIAQGLLGSTYKFTNDENMFRLAPSTMSIQNRFRSNYSDLDSSFLLAAISYNAYTTNDVVMFACPEYVYQPDDFKYILEMFKNTISIRKVADYTIANILSIANSYEYTFYNLELADFILKQNRTALPTAGPIFIKDNNRYGETISTYDGMYESYNNHKRIGFSYIYPDGYLKDEVLLHYDLKYEENKLLYASAVDYETLYSIKNASYAKSPGYYSFTDTNTHINVNNDVTVVGDKQFINWDAPIFYYRGVYGDTNFPGSAEYKISSGKSCVVFESNIPLINPIKLYPDNKIKDIVPITVVDIQNNNVIPYGGTSEQAKLNSIFYSFGDYIDTTQYPIGSSNRINITTNNGDCYVSYFTYNSSHVWRSSDEKYDKVLKDAIVYNVPIVSSINLTATYGNLRVDTTNESSKFYLRQDEPVASSEYNQDKAAYLYNTIYNTVPTAMSFATIDYSRPQLSEFDCRVLYSNEKTNNEYIDNWKVFKSANFIDVDTRYGEITNLRLFKDTLIFWQENATGVLSVNERTMLQDVNDTNIILGNGDVLQRHDYLTTEYGMKPGQTVDGQSNTTLYWWDGYKKEILSYAGGQHVQPMKKEKSISNYINTNNEASIPSIAYDIKYNELLMSVVGNNPIIYNENIQQFTSIYETPFEYKMAFADKLLLIHNNEIYNWDSKGIGLIPYLKYIINKNSVYPKVYDNVQFGGTFYQNGTATGEEVSDSSIGKVSNSLRNTRSTLYNNSRNASNNIEDQNNVKPLIFSFKTPLNQFSSLTGDSITNREYDYRFAIPRNKDSLYGDRMRGKTMQCELTSSSSSADFSLQYIITKFRISWS